MQLQFNRYYHSTIDHSLTQYSIVAVYYPSKSPPKLYLSIYCKFLSRKTMFCSITSTAGWSGLYPPSLQYSAVRVVRRLFGLSVTGNFTGVVEEVDGRDFADVSRFGG
jgi:hypothetical protein